MDPLWEEDERRRKKSIEISGLDHCTLGRSRRWYGPTENANYPFDTAPIWVKINSYGYRWAGHKWTPNPCQQRENLIFHNSVHFYSWIKIELCHNFKIVAYSTLIVPTKMCGRRVENAEKLSCVTRTARSYS